MFLGELLTRAAKWYPDKTGSIDCSDDTTFTFLQLNERCNALAHALINMGVRPQDRVAIVCHNSHYYLESVFAIAKTGGVATNLNWRLAPKELAFLLDHSDAQIVIFSKMFESLLKPIRENLSKEVQFIAVGGEMENTIDYEELNSKYPKTEPPVELNDPDDTVLQMYTSGTTGQPKGVMLTHKNIISHSINTIIEQQVNRNSKTLAVLPMFHVAIYLPINAVFVGGTIVFQPTFDPEAIFSIIEKEKIESIGLAPAMLGFLINHPKIDEYDLSSLKEIGYAAAPMPVPLLKRAMKRFNCNFTQVFGQTETCPVISILTPEDHVIEGPEYKVRRLGSVGRPILNVKVKVVDSQGNECPQGEVGEIIASGNTIMKGYYKMPELTRETIKDNWIYTGDMGYFDEYGYLYLADRKKDMIISGGENIYPTEIEMCIKQLEEVADVAVIGVPDEKWGEAVKALILLKPGCELTEEKIIEHCAKNIASYKKPKSVEFVTEDFPRNAMGKILKNKVREPYWQGRERKL